LPSTALPFIAIYCPSLHCHLLPFPLLPSIYIPSFIQMPSVVLKLFPGQLRDWTNGQTDMPTLHIVNYFVGTDVFMNFNINP